MLSCFLNASQNIWSQHCTIWNTGRPLSHCVAAVSTDVRWLSDTPAWAPMLYLPYIQPPPLKTPVTSRCVLRHPVVSSFNLSWFCLSLWGSHCKMMCAFVLHDFIILVVAFVILMMCLCSLYPWCFIVSVNTTVFFYWFVCWLVQSVCSLVLSLVLFLAQSKGSLLCFSPTQWM